MPWESLVSIAREAAQYRAEEARRPVACPMDGEPLETGPRGELHCRFCGFKPL